MKWNKQFLGSHLNPNSKVGQYLFIEGSENFNKKHNTSNIK